MNEMLSAYLHNFRYSEFRYIYPVVSRRLGGLSIGINLVNQCNWNCVYCDAPKEQLIGLSNYDVDLNLLRKELDAILETMFGKVFSESDAELKSITIAGNGEPSLSNDLGEAFLIIGEMRQKYSIGQDVKTLLITNGSRLGEESLQNDIRILSTINGEVWFKIDSIIESSARVINRCRISPVQTMNVIEKLSAICPIFIQTCFFRLNNMLPSEAEIKEYLAFLNSIKGFIKGVFLYTASRKPFADFGVSVEPASLKYLENLNSRIQDLGIESKFYK